VVDLHQESRSRHLVLRLRGVLHPVGLDLDSPSVALAGIEGPKGQVTLAERALVQLAKLEA
jgi:hypothetical protein